MTLYLIALHLVAIAAIASHFIQLRPPPRLVWITETVPEELSMEFSDTVFLRTDLPGRGVLGAALTTDGTLRNIYVRPSTSRVFYDYRPIASGVWRQNAQIFATAPADPSRIDDPSQILSDTDGDGMPDRRVTWPSNVREVLVDEPWRPRGED